MQAATEVQADRYFAACRHLSLGLVVEASVQHAWIALVDWCGGNKVAALTEAERAIARFDKVGWS